MVLGPDDGVEQATRLVSRMAGKAELSVRELLERHGRLYAEDAGIRLAAALVRVSLSQRAASEVTASVRD